jgi:hypothetical protein
VAHDDDAQRPADTGGDIEHGLKQDPQLRADCQAHPTDAAAESD